ncbi:YggS family pyridoxal phosphate-dependent enzyme [Thiohalomonas denitrificans]|uniref:YggS family pyridoxal phosphate-dependent enzyme n=1 Tax=Thiohalomonas denitrificans TaxID=415747 RepID=UPI0026F1A45C|nr:YggS family pyridoxal phosphate-dependent enzyme [Thiohalomonas denitrificans]
MTYNNDNLTTRLAAVRDRLRKAERRFGREEDAVALVAVSKTRPAEAIRACAEAGQRLFGESYLQEATDKVAALSGLNLQWHFIGPIQSNKTRPIAEHFQWVHSVDRFKIARRLSEQRPEGLPPLNICLQVNVGGETGKSGAGLDELPNLAQEVAALPNLHLRGLMCIPAPTENFEKQREPFHRLHEAKAALQRDGLDLDTLSMGMSHDLEAAVAEGATMVRIGTAIFGPRNYR